MGALGPDGVASASVISFDSSGNWSVKGAKAIAITAVTAKSGQTGPTLAFIADQSIFSAKSWWAQRVVGLRTGGAAVVFSSWQVDPPGSPAELFYGRLTPVGPTSPDPVPMAALPKLAAGTGIRTGQSGFLWVTATTDLLGFLVGDECGIDTDCDDAAPCSVDSCGAHGCEHFWPPTCPP